MKTKDFIKELQKVDPSGQLECCIGNGDINHIEVLEAYYDGCMHVIERDEKGYAIKGKIVSDGYKVSIKSIGIDDVIFNNPDIPVEYVGVSCDRKTRYDEWVEECRNRARKIKNECDCDAFIEYIKKRLQDHEEFDDIELIAKKFYEENMFCNDEMPDDIKYMQNWQSLSWNQRKGLQWNRELYIDFGKNGLVIGKNEIYTAWGIKPYANTFVKGKEKPNYEDCKDLIWTIYARDWNEACTKYHELQGWEPYKPMECILRT